ncbi:MAG TPA: hypothetical protein VEV17_21040 [Bryobacteraceae bacterium]|nr:hypothetical protein [Bryobacteraceae bacterium]
MKLATFSAAGQPALAVLCRRAFSFPAALGSSLVALSVLTVRSRFSDPDLWWHLRTGQIIATQRVIPRIDLFSFATRQHAWVAHEWLSQVFLYGVWRAGGYAGLMLWFCVLAAGLLLLEYLLCSIYANHAKVAFLGALVTWLFATIGLAIRPQMLGYFLLACELLLVQLGRSRDPRWFLLLPPLLALWANCHGSFFLGLMLLAVLLACSFIDWRAGLLDSRPLESSRRKVFAAAAALSLPAVFLNPVGLPLLAYPLRTIFDARMQLDAVSEWRRLAFDDPRAFLLLAVAGLIVLLALVGRIPLYLDECAVLSLAFGMAVLHQRLLFAWGIVAAPVLCRQLAGLWDGYDPARDHRLANALLILAALTIAIGAFPGTSNLAAQVTRDNPTQAVQFLRRARLPGNMLNEYVYGGYLIWADPEQRVFIDGRADVYAWTGVLKDYGEWATLETDPNVLLDRYRIAFCLLSRSMPLARVLRYLPGWHELYSDSQAVIFVRTGAKPGTP